MQKIENFIKLLLQQGADPDIACQPFAQDDMQILETNQLSTRTLCTKVLDLLDTDYFKDLSEETLQNIKNIYQIILTLPVKQEATLEQIQEEENASFCPQM